MGSVWHLSFLCPRLPLPHLRPSPSSSHRTLSLRLGTGVFLLLRGAHSLFLKKKAQGLTFGQTSVAATARAGLLTSSRAMPPPSAKDIKKILDSMGIEADDDLLDKVICELTGKSIEDIMAQGIGKLASVTAGGAVAIRASPGSAAPAAGSIPAGYSSSKGKMAKSMD